MQAGTKLKTAAEVAGVWQNQGNPAMSSHTLPVRSGIALEIRWMLWEPAQLYNYKYIWLAHGRNSWCSTRLCVWFRKKAAINRLQARTVCPSTILGLAICKLHCNLLCCSAAKAKALWFSSHSSGYNKEVVCAESCPSFTSLRIHCPALAYPRHHLPRECLKIFSHSLKLQFSVCMSSKGKRFMETIVFPVPQT